MFSSDDQLELRTMARSVVGKVSRELPQMQQWPATVLSYDEDTALAGGIAIVHVDGDPPDTTTSVTSVLGRKLSPGDRVLLVFDPPHGAYVAGFAGKPQVPAAPVPPYTRSGPLTDDDESLLWTPTVEDVRVTFFIFLLLEPGSDDTVIEIKRDGVVLGTATIPSSVTRHDHTLDVVLAVGRLLHFRVVTAGGGASGLTIIPTS